MFGHQLDLPFALHTLNEDVWSDVASRFGLQWVLMVNGIARFVAFIVLWPSI